MSRRRWIQDPRTLELVPAEEYHPPVINGPYIVPDIPDFVSVIDGSIVRGRAGVREHCLKHDVVPTAELKGLPFKQAVDPWVHTPADRASIREEIARNMENARRK